jgi:hypothetical protein
LQYITFYIKQIKKATREGENAQEHPHRGKKTIETLLREYKKIYIERTKKG